MDLCQVNPEFNLYDPDWPLRTYMPQAPPAKFVFAEEWRRGEAEDSLISQGCIVSGSTIYGSVLCPNVRVHSFCHIDQCILMPGVRVGRHARIRRAIIDRDVLIPRGALIGYDADEDRRRHTVTDSGVVVVTTDDEPLIGPLSDEALRYEFDGFTFVARRIDKGSRIRMLVQPINSPFWQKNYNSGGEVSDESAKDARMVTVTLYHDPARPSALYLPLAAKE